MVRPRLLFFTELLHSIATGLILSAAVLASACSSKSPSEPSPTATGSAPTTYIGAVQLSDGREGTLVLSANPTLTAFEQHDGRNLMRSVWSILEPRLFAQSSSASGQLILSDSVVALSGTFSGSTFTVSGGGFALTATTSGGSLSGSGTGPDGVSASVTPVATVSAPSPPSSNAAGLYKATFNFVADSFATSKRSGVVEFSCSYQTIVTGSMNIELESRGGDSYLGTFDDSWTETQGSRGSCGQAFVDAPILNAPVGFSSMVTASSIQFGASVGGSVSSIATQTRTHTFVGTVSGNTIVGRMSYSRLYTETQPPPSTLTFSHGYPSTGVNVTLVKQ